MEKRNAVCDWFCINKSGSNYPIYDYNVTTQKFTRVGTLYNREAFVFLGGDNFDYIKFLASDGTLKTACIDPVKYPVPYAFCTDYPYSREVINGTEYCIFKMRQSKNIYDAAGNYWGKVAAGMYVATNSDAVGGSENNKHLKLINYVKSTSGQWVAVTGAGMNHGFVDSGLKSASGYSSIAFYGSW